MYAEEDPVDISLETSDGGHYQLPSVARSAARAALAKAQADGTTFSITNQIGGALVVPWASVHAVYLISIYAPPETAWDLLWQRSFSREECASR